MNEYLIHIQNQAADLGDAIEDVLDTLLSSRPEFTFWSGSHHPYAHHYGKFGLIKHTAEVIRLCFATKKVTGVSVDDGELFLAALFHDTGKLFDYEPIDSTYLQWAPTSHKRLIHHISRSALIWHDCAEKHPDVYTRYHDNVLHAILSHHGQREFGSPVAPKSKVAWLVHLCDSISARMDDANRLDQITFAKEMDNG